jgi:hypothetical protein
MATHTGEKKPVEKLLPLVPLAIGFGLVLMKGLHKGDPKGFKSHHHQALEHTHAHVHVTHNRSDEDKKVGGWQHLTSEHEHPHNHPALEHSHRPHRDFEDEHRHEAHVHDHEHPTHS